MKLVLLAVLVGPLVGALTMTLLVWPVDRRLHRLGFSICNRISARARKLIAVPVLQAATGIRLRRRGLLRMRRNVVRDLQRELDFREGGLTSSIELAGTAGIAVALGVKALSSWT